MYGGTPVKLLSPLATGAALPHGLFASSCIVCSVALYCQYFIGESSCSSHEVDFFLARPWDAHLTPTLGPCRVRLMPPAGRLWLPLRQQQLWL